MLARSIALQRRALEFVTDRHDLGAVSGLDVAQQQALLDNTLTQVDVLKKQRSQYEHAIATLTGTPAPLFSIAPDLQAPGAARRSRSACLRTRWSAGPTSHPPSARWPPPTRRSASPRRPSIRA